MSDSEISPDQIIEWLDNQSDFTLEMKVFSRTKQVGFQIVEHGGTYEDPVTKLSRQFDVRAKAWSKMDQNRCIKLAVECKALSKDFPLVIQRVLRHHNESYHEIYHAHANTLFQEHHDNPVMQAMEPDARVLRTQHESLIYQVDKFVGKSSNQIGKKKNGELFANDKEVYNKWAQAIASAHDLIFECRREREQQSLIESFTVVIPILVVPNGCLWVVDYDPNGTRIKNPKNYDQTSIYIGKECTGDSNLLGDNYCLSHLEVMTLNGYTSFVDKICSNSDVWDAYFALDSVRAKN